MIRSSARLLIIASLLAMAGCSKQNVIADPPVTGIDTAAMVRASGVFMNGPFGVVAGQARIYGDGENLSVALENFSSSGGPDLKVYLSRELDPVHFVNLGSLKAVAGNQAYRCPPGVVISNYKYVLIYCQQYKHLFGSAIF